MAKTILIVEDDELSMKLFNDLLQTHGYQTIQSVDGSDVGEIANERRPDLIIMDIQLPGTSGLEHIMMLKADDTLKDIPIIAVTAFGYAWHEVDCLKAGCDRYLTKPIFSSKFLEMVAELIG